MASQRFLTNLDLHQNELQNVVVQNLATDPESPKIGQFWFNTAAGQFKFKQSASDIKTFESKEDLLVVLADYQTKITASGILKGDGTGTITSASAGTDYGYAELIGSSDPTTSTEGAVGQHYLNTTSKVEFVCVAASAGTYTWEPVTTDISSKQDTITAVGILKGAGAGSISSAVAGTDYAVAPLSGSSAPTTSTEGIVGQKYFDTAGGMEYICTNVDDTETPAVYTWEPVITATASRALVSDANGKIVASDITATELGYLDGVTSNIQDQLDAVPKLQYLDAVSCTVSDGATQTEINTAAIAAISAAYASPAKYDAVNVAITFTPSDRVKDGLYMYNGSAWVFEFYTTTGIQLANGTTAGLIQEADSDSDLTLTNGVATVNVASALRTARTIGIVGTYGSTPSTDGITATGASFDGSGNANINVTAIKTEMLSGQVAVANGGTGKSSITEGNVLVGNATGGFDELGIDTTVTTSSDNLVTSGAVAAAIGGGNVAHKYSETNPALTPSSGEVTWTVTHNLNTRDVSVTIHDASTYEQVIADVTMSTVNTVIIKMNAASVVAAGSYSVTVIG